MPLIASAERPADGASEAARAGLGFDAFPLRTWRFRRVQAWRMGGRVTSVMVRVSARPAGCQAQVWLGYVERARISGTA